MDSIINTKLRDIEEYNKVKTLYACESGSRAWGFASPDSDYDVRFIYVHNKDYYFSIDEQRDVIEPPIDDVLDISGWELRKALRLFRKSNGPLYEWLQSPIVYQSDPSFLAGLHELMSTYFSARPMMHHYLSMAKNVLANDLSGDEVRLKKYFYALRPLLASRWIADKREVPPMEFGKLRTLLDAELSPVVDELLSKKAQVNEKFTISPITELHQWIIDQIEYCESHVPDQRASVDSKMLNDLFRKSIV
jgi:predicted nucleotidyltransferase